MKKAGKIIKAYFKKHLYTKFSNANICMYVHIYKVTKWFQQIKRESIKFTIE